MKNECRQKVDKVRLSGFDTKKGHDQCRLMVLKVVATEAKYRFSGTFYSTFHFTFRASLLFGVYFREFKVLVIFFKLTTFRQ